MSTAAGKRQWAGVAAPDRRQARRGLLLEAGYRLFAGGGVAALSVRALAREAQLNARYFYENFESVDDLVGALYDQQAELLAQRLEPVLDLDAASEPTVIRHGIDVVLRFITEDPVRARLLFTDAPDSSVLERRRRAALAQLVDAAFLRSRSSGAVGDRTAAAVFAAMFGGAMEQLVQEWSAGLLGRDLDRVIELAYRICLAMSEAAARAATPARRRRSAGMA